MENDSSEKRGVRLLTKGKPGSLTSTLQTFIGDLTQLTTKASGIAPVSAKSDTKPEGTHQNLIFRTDKKKRPGVKKD